ncbi:MAG: LysR substrate-binding domain-containing protein [Microcoleaceae cyanobacterium]
MDIQRLINLELRQICYFILLVQANNNFSEAAKRLGIKQPPFSQRIQALENSLKSGKNAPNVKLLNRNKSPIELTEAGKVFLEEVQLAVMHLDRGIIQAQKASQGQIGLLKVGMYTSFATSILPNILKEFKSRFPEVELELREIPVKQEIQLLKTHQVDLVFHNSDSFYQEDSGLDCMPILQESFMVVLPQSHSLANQTQISLSALKNEDIILPSLDAFPFYQQVINLCQQAGFEPKIIKNIHVTGIVTILSLVAAEIGIAILPDHGQVLYRQDVIYRPLQDSRLTRQAVAVWRQDDSSIVLHQFLNVMQAVIKLPS